MLGMISNKFSIIIEVVGVQHAVKLSSCRSFFNSPPDFFSRRVFQPNFVKINKAGKKESSSETVVMDDNQHSKFYDESIGLNLKNSHRKDQNLLDLNSKTKILPKYEKIDRKSNLLSKVLAKMLLKKSKSDLMLLEGKRLINDAIDSQAKIHQIFFSSKEDLNEISNLDTLIAIQQTQLIKIPYNDLKLYSSLTTPPGLMAVAEKPRNDDIVVQNQNNHLPLTLILDNVRDPGNLGTIIRTCAAAGLKKIILLQGCVDAWSPKVIKSAAGAHFKVPIEVKINWKDVLERLPKRFELFVADSRADDFSTESLESINYFMVNFFTLTNNNSKVLIIGNEAFGLSRNSYEFAVRHSGKRLKIPLYTDLESLNSAIASAVLIYEIRRQYDLIDINKNFV